MAQFYRRPMMHFDRRELYTDLEMRVRYLHSFLDFSTRMYPFRRECAAKETKAHTSQATSKPWSPGKSTSRH